MALTSRHSTDRSDRLSGESISGHCFSSAGTRATTSHPLLSVGRSGLGKCICIDHIAGMAALHNFKISILLPKSVGITQQIPLSSTLFVPHHSEGCKSPFYT